MTRPTQPAVRRTVRRSAAISGKTLLTGQSVTVSLHPAESGSGIVFRHGPTGTDIPATLEYAADVPQCTALQAESARIDFVEHLLAALAAGGITDALIEVEGSEVPLLDGSAAPYEALLREAQPQPLAEAVEPIELHESVKIETDEKVIIALPGEPAYWYLLDHEHPLIGRQAAIYRPRRDDFRSQVAPARTFTTEEEARALIAARGLEGADEGMAIVAYADRLSAPEPFPNSFAMHKVIDMLGDLYLLSRPLNATVIAYRTGHTDNRALAQAIGLQTSDFRPQTSDLRLRTSDSGPQTTGLRPATIRWEAVSCNTESSATRA
jgi:UDP-3-O-[3-hydroxymyristoyl] N-acetylglucosamine deacetylase